MNLCITKDVDQRNKEVEHTQKKFYQLKKITNFCWFLLIVCEKAIWLLFPLKFNENKHIDFNKKQMCYFKTNRYIQNRNPKGEKNQVSKYPYIFRTTRRISKANKRLFTRCVLSLAKRLADTSKILNLLKIRGVVFKTANTWIVS